MKIIATFVHLLIDGHLVTLSSDFSPPPQLGYEATSKVEKGGGGFSSILKAGGGGTVLLSLPFLIQLLNPSPHF